MVSSRVSAIGTVSHSQLGVSNRKPSDCDGVRAVKFLIHRGTGGQHPDHPRTPAPPSIHPYCWLADSTDLATPSDRRGASMTQQLTATGGTPPYTWSTVSTLPAGITLSSGGLLAGTPSAAASGSFTVRLTDSVGATTTADVWIDAIAIAPAIPPVIEQLDFTVSIIAEVEMSGSDLAIAPLVLAIVPEVAFKLVTPLLAVSRHAHRGAVVPRSVANARHAHRGAIVPRSVVNARHQHQGFATTVNLPPPVVVRHQHQGAIVPRSVANARHAHRGAIVPRSVVNARHQHQGSATTENRAPGYSATLATLRGTSGLTQLFSGSGVDEGNTQLPDIGFDFPLYGTNYRTNIYVNSNAYLTFGFAGTIYSGFSVTNPGRALHVAPGDRSYDQVWGGTSGRGYRIVWVGSRSYVSGFGLERFEVTFFPDGAIMLVFGTSTLNNGERYMLTSGVTLNTPYTWAQNSSFVWTPDGSGSYIVRTGSYT
jgi:hypothetical protein